jgi:hypothetical protein
MPSLLSQEEKNLINSIFDDIHDTFAQTIYVYVKTPVVIADDSDFNPLYGRKKDSQNINSDVAETKYEYQARVYYPKDQDQDITDAGSQFNLVVSKGRVRLKVTVEAYEKMKVASRIEVNDYLYVIDSDPTFIGPFGVRYCHLYLKREN